MKKNYLQKKKLEKEIMKIILRQEQTWQKKIEKKLINIKKILLNKCGKTIYIINN